MVEAVARRLLKELKDYQKEPNPDLAELSPISDDNILIWNAVLRGEPETPYEGNVILLQRFTVNMFMAFLSLLGGHWTLRIEIPKTYPIHPPKVKFLTKICHPNISFKVRKSSSIYHIYHIHLA
jgi:peroxin-4